MKRLCPVCFTELPENANYCLVCGKCMRENVEQTVQYIGCSPVVKLAADDYRRALIRLRRHSKDTNALHTKIECELFFRKGIEMYSDMDGEVLIKGIQERVRREHNEQRTVK